MTHIFNHPVGVAISNIGRHIFLTTKGTTSDNARNVNSRMSMRSWVPESLFLDDYTVHSQPVIVRSSTVGLYYLQLIIPRLFIEVQL